MEKSFSLPGGTERKLEDITYVYFVKMLSWLQKSAVTYFKTPWVEEKLTVSDAERSPTFKTGE